LNANIPANNYISTKQKNRHRGGIGMRKHFMHLKEAPFRQIWDGHKTIELRLYDEKRQLLQPGA